jgi:predicted transcriptional regulator
LTLTAHADCASIAYAAYEIVAYARYAMKARVTLSLDEGQVHLLDAEAERTHRTRSALVEEALAAWQRKRLEDELAAGYQAMAAENARVAEEGMAAYDEVAE